MSLGRLLLMGSLLFVLSACDGGDSSGSGGEPPASGEEAGGGGSGEGAGPGEGGCMLHNPNYDFNDEVMPAGVAYWCALVQRLLGGVK